MPITRGVYGEADAAPPIHDGTGHTAGSGTYRERPAPGRRFYRQ